MQFRRLRCREPSRAIAVASRFMSKRNTLAGVASVLMLVAGFGVSVLGFFALVVGGLSSDGPPTCNGKVMHPGDKCWTQFGGETDLVSYEEMLRRNESGSGRHQVQTAGGICLGGGAVLLLSGWWTGRRAA